jgi:tetratricopeptide (TPR) repeat protein
MTGWAAVLAVLAAVQADPATESRSEARIAGAAGYVEAAGEDDGNWFRFAFSHQRFRLPADDREAAPMIQVLGAAAEREVAIRVRYDVWAGRIDRERGVVTYPLCAISVSSGASVGNENANCPAGAASSPGSTEGALARGLALIEQRPEEARRLLGVALGDATLPARLRAVALQGRTDAAEAMVELLTFGSEARDRMLFAGLEDSRRWAAADPESREAQLATARLLMGLGGYPEAERAYLAIEQRWPDQAFEVAVRIGSLQRQQGRYSQALRALDDFARREGPREGMKFRFHRAWTLTLLNRPAEAVADLDRGLETQPDYIGAYLMRACAYGQLGRIEEALADEERGLELVSGLLEDLTPTVSKLIADARAITASLRSLAASRSRAPTNIACDRHWENDIRPRQRSPLLPAADAAYP